MLARTNEYLRRASRTDVRDGELPANVDFIEKERLGGHIQAEVARLRKEIAGLGSSPVLEAYLDDLAGYAEIPGIKMTSYSTANQDNAEAVER